MESMLASVANYGFPAVMCILMWYMMNKQMKSLEAAIDNNTKAIQNLTKEANK